MRHGKWLFCLSAFVVGGVAQLASSWVRSTRNLKPIANKQTSSISIERRPEVSSACGPRLEASRATLPATGRKGVGVDERAWALTKEPERARVRFETSKPGLAPCG